eukprot:TRINITY_DN65160_c0_g1_i1.p1 TRINITY_DN65160_c0_g1~~TRINITY_DN65160_c0_g1_i1.p1  ORF type:complete len:253 (+),score=36.49 TRINITY_DN65160_c0_g1_i1:54-812(+)
MKAMKAKFDRDGDGEITAAEVVATLRDTLRLVKMDAPCTLGLCACCLVVHLVTRYVWSTLTRDYFQLWPWAYASPWTPIFYIRMVTQVFGHGGWEHLSGNLSLLILVGPAAEAAYGTRVVLLVMLLTAITTSILHYLFAPAAAVQLGASGIVYMLIMLNSLRDHKEGMIRASFLALLVLWVLKEGTGFISSVLPGGQTDGISHHCHLFGAGVGAVSGLLLQDQTAADEAKRLKRRMLATVRGLVHGAARKDK